MKLSRLDLTETLGADKTRSHVMERIINLTLDILYLLTGEDYIVLKMSYGQVTHSSSPCVSGGFGRTQIPTSKLTPDRNEKKILEVTQKIIDLLTGEEGGRSVQEMSCMSKFLGQEENHVLSSEDESSNRAAPMRCPRPLYSRDQEENLNNGKSKDRSQNAVIFCIKKEANVSGETSKARRRGRPRKKRTLGAAPRPQSPLSLKDIHVITEDFQDEAREVMASEDDLQNQNKEQVTKDLHTGGSQDKPASVPAMEVEEDEDDNEESSRSRRWRPPKEAELSIMTEEEEEEEEESPRKDSDWEISADGSPHRIGPSRDDSSEDSIIKISLDNVQEASEAAEAVNQSFCRRGKKITFTCLDCGRCFASSEQLQSHHKVHTGEAPFSCMACGSSFSSSEELGEHVAVHTSEKLFACSQCGKCFTIKANLIAHRRMHVGDKPFACAECGRRFALRSSLEAHLPVHAIEKPYPCALCGKCFTTSGRLAVHQTTHTGEKTYECEDCGKIFTTSSSMNRHRRTHTGEKPYSCIMCGKCFNRETNLYRHQMIHTR
ncbi:uncharacterized protein LOC143955250 [Lithobates pipiens]